MLLSAGDAGGAVSTTTTPCYSDAVVSQVLDELGLQLGDQLSGLPQAAGSLAPQVRVPSGPTPVAAGAGGPGGGLTDADAELQARLDNLRRE